MPLTSFGVARREQSDLILTLKIIRGQALMKTQGQIMALQGPQGTAGPTNEGGQGSPHAHQVHTPAEDAYTQHPSAQDCHVMGRCLCSLCSSL